MAKPQADKPAHASHHSQVKKPQSGTRHVTLNDVLAKYKISDDATITRLIKELTLPMPTATNGQQPKRALLKATVDEYASSMRVLATRLSPDSSGQPRHALPSFAECMLRPNGPRFIRQFLSDPGEARRVAISMLSTVTRCFPTLDAGDRERAIKAWRAELSESRRLYLQARATRGGFGGYVNPKHLVTGGQISAAIEALPLGSAERCILRLLQCAVPHFPTRYQVNSPLLNLGHIMIVEKASAPNLDKWLSEVVIDAEREKGLLIRGPEGRLTLALVFDVTRKDGPVGSSFNLTSLQAGEVQAYLATLDTDATVLFPQVRNSSSQAPKPYIGAEGRSAFGARLNRMLAKSFGTNGGVPLTHALFRLSLVTAHKQQLNNPESQGS